MTPDGNPRELKRTNCRDACRCKAVGQRRVLLESKEPAPLPGMSVSTPCLRKSPPALNVWVPTNLEKEALPPIDFQVISVGSIAPSVLAAFWS